MKNKIYSNLQQGDKPSLSFIICTEQGSLEQKSILFSMTLRAFGGILASAPIISFQPRPGYEISHKTKKVLSELNVEHIEIPLNKKYIEYPLANKPLVCSYCEKNLDSEILVFADSDQIIINEPSELFLPQGFDVGLRPVDLKGIGALNEKDSNYRFWEELYSLLDVKNRYYVLPSAENNKILAYWNSGLVSAKRNKGIFSKWEENFHEAFNKGLKPKQGIFFLEQSVLSATVLQLNASVLYYSSSYNYPIHLQDSLRKELQIETLENMTTVHYHQLFNDLRFKHPLNRFCQYSKENKNNAIYEQIDLSGIYPKSFIKLVIWFFKKLFNKIYKRLNFKILKFD